METESWLALAFAILAVALLSRALGRVYLTAPVACLALGYGLHAAGLVPSIADEETLEVVAEATLALVLFGDAAALDAACLRKRATWVLRMLVVAMPLALLFGFLVFLAVLPDWPMWQVALVAALLVPTDGALGQGLLANDRVPVEVRETLSAESGLNDGLALPAIVFIACAAVGYEHDLQESNWVVFAIKQIGFGLGAGAIIGLAGALLVMRATDRGTALRSTAILALVALAYFSAELIGGNSLIACFCAGAALAWATPDVADEHDVGGHAGTAHRFIETDGFVLTLIAFLYVGAVLLPGAVDRFQPIWLVGILAALFVVRPLAVYLSLLGTDATWRERLVFGWFGPRGLATALFAVFALVEFDKLEMAQDILAIAALTVAVSALLHGATAFLAPLFCAAPDHQTSTAGGHA